MEKDLRVEEIYQARQNLRAHGIRACYFLQFGYPGEEWDHIQRTIHMVRETQPDDIGVSVAYPLPGTKFYELVETQLGTKKNWDDSDDLSIMFRGSYTSEFYRALRDALHLEVAAGDPGEIEQSWQRLESLRSRSLTAEPTLIGFGARG
jgi:anaerobic magnesium-protoporphyrin IX monomethyl ester cyclase